MKYLSLFSGIGGFELGIKQAYESNNEYAPFGSESEQEKCTQGGKRSTNQHGALLHSGDRTAPLCIGYSEIDKYACQIYDKHFNHKNYGDITKIDPRELPDFDCLVGGFPCQAFSIAGKRKGFDDTRGTLFFDIARILSEKRPRLLVLENVKGLLSHDKGQTFQTILGVLSDLGYAVEWQVLNSKNFGVPQNRERVFIIGYLRGTSRPQVFPIRGSDQELDREADKQRCSNTLTGRSAGGQNRRGNYIKVAGNLNNETWKKRHESIRRVYDTDGISPTIPTGTGGGVMNKIVQPVLTPDREKKRQNGRRFKEEGEPSFTLTGQDKHGVMVDTKIRRLTPKECERLQGFPDDWTADLSDTQRYKTLGNAVTVNVIKEIFNRIQI